jgi:hypothetical protein
MPWPVRWMNQSPKPASVMTRRAMPSTSSHEVPTVAPVTAAAWASCSTA